MNGFQELPDADEPLHPFLDTNEETPVSSSWVASLRYDRSSQTLWMRVRATGREYAYESVSPAKALEALNAPSVGQWFWANYPPRGR